ncbi:MAG: ABC transporter ATP-binding protein [Bacilli bacterium]|nr:ABC transporter ATP-binding protein [Bacilli bacterium]
MITINSLTKRFEDTVAVNNLSLQIAPGVIGLVGHNGAGKSTLFRLISDVLDVDEGEILVDGIPHLDPHAKAKVFFLSDDPYAPKGENYKGVYRFYANFYPIDFEKYSSLIAMLRLPTNRNVGQFSKGMRRQLFLALALSVEADYYLLDEAFDGIDPLALDEIKAQIIKLGEAGKTVVLSSHNIASLERLVDRFIVLYCGSLSKEGNSEQLGQDLTKYQAMFKEPINEDDFAKIGVKVLSLKRIGSIYHVVLIGAHDVDGIINEKLHPLLWENVPIDPDEVIALQMLLAKKGGELHE